MTNDLKIIHHTSSGDWESCIKGGINRKYFHSAMVAFQQEEYVGSLCIYYNPEIKHKNQSALLIGNLDCIDNAEIFGQIIDKVSEVASSLNTQYIIGPINGSTWEEYRIPERSQTTLFLGDIQEPEYYHNFYQRNGFEVLYRYFTSTATPKVFDKTKQIEALQLQGVRIRNIDLSSYAEELQSIYNLCMIAFRENELFTPISIDDFISKYIPYKQLIEERFVLIAEDSKGIIAFIFCYPDYTNTEQKKLIIKTIARNPEKTYKGLIDTMVNLIYKRAHEEHFQSVIHAFMHEKNKSHILSPRYGGTITKSYRLYIKSLNG